MQKKKLLVLVTAVGILGTSAAVGASGLVSKVNGVLNKGIVVSVNGTDTTLHPVYIGGKAYLPARDTAEALGYNLNWNSKGKEIELTEQEEEAVEYVPISGVIVNATPIEDGKYRLELLGKGSNNWIILTADKDTVLTNETGDVFAAKDLKVGTRVYAEYGPVIAMSFPGQSHAAKIVVGSESLVKEDVIQAVEKTDDGWQVKFGETKDGVTTTTLVLNAGKETSVLTSEGQSVDWADVKAGTKVTAYYGPIMTKSLPPQSPLHYLVIPQANAPAAPAGKMSPEVAQEYREIAWNNLSAEAKSHLITKKDEAQVSIIASGTGGIMTTTDAQKKRLEEIKAANGHLIEVKYSTDQDALLGPLTLVLDPETKEVLGTFIRK
ncbi:stalk domain-containing protein [Cohnella luojiensis]|uniref:Copper amine oxidase-like N-terminal domain-containing protein n=1 Tax=Cohnella luojiensis TaxID=652876 RepID=A0A4Y8M6C4_9BACL|nr:stalk domain-containing protein [Cohnella luojiensis]TFE28944.1 hypothetical protein E2980_06000 [Cohnella luojiensis]